MSLQGRTLDGKYRLTRFIAAGGMGQVWQATVVGAAGFRRQVAIKLISPERATSAATVTSFIEEAKLCAALRHPNIVATLDFGFERGEYFLVMELLEGRSLRSLLRQLEPGQGLSTEVALQIAADAAAGLAYAHQAIGDDGRPLGLVHRDIKPGNIMISQVGEVKLADFGIAKAGIRTTRTSTGALKGTLAYMSPEQANGRPIDTRSDIFSLGLVIHEVLGGTRAYRGEELEVLAQAQAGQVPELPVAVPPELRAVVRQAVAPTPEDRYPDASALAHALREILDALPGRGDARGAIAAIAGDTTERPPDSVLGETQPVPSEIQPGEGRTAPTVVDAPRTLIAHPAKRRTRRGLAIAGGLLGLGLLGLAATSLLDRGSSVAPATVADSGLATHRPPSDARRRATAPATAPASAPATAPASAPAPAAAPRRPRALSGTRPRPGGTGTLRIRVVPWGTVWLDEQRLGMTPLPPTTLAAGRHVLTVEGPGGKRQTRRVRVRAGRALRVVVRF